jgi:hypothetical protein
MLSTHSPATPGALSNNVVLHDLTEALGKDCMHSRYPENGSAAASSIAHALSESIVKCGTTRAIGISDDPANIRIELRMIATQPYR